MTNVEPRNLLIVGTGNVGRSIMAEAYVNAVAEGAWKASSAGAQPAGRINPLAAITLAEFDLRPSLRSKSWTEFSGPGGPLMEVVITVSEEAAGEACPLWRGTPRMLHWPIPDPTLAVGTLEDRMAAFRAVFDAIKMNVDRFLAEEASAAAA
ncbi:MAG: arsenate reductase ArsC [Hyphomicrobiaceae bacterium]